MTGKEFKNWVAGIPDDAVVTCDGRELHITSVTCESPAAFGYPPTAEIKVVIAGRPRSGRPFPDAETR